MKKSIMSITIFLLSMQLFAQQSIFKDNIFNSADYSIEVIKCDDYYNIVLERKGLKNDTTSLYSWKQEIIYNILSTTRKSEKEVVKEASRIFYAIPYKELESQLKSNQSIAANIGFEACEVRAYNSRLIRKGNPYGYIDIFIDSIKIEIAETFIENILVYGKIINGRDLGNRTSDYLMLRNYQPLGLSSMNSIVKILNKRCLYTTIGGEKYEVPASNIINFYYPELENGRRDYSPADTTFTLIKEAGLQTIQLKKTPSNKLFELKVYSDFLGMDETNPNGIIQTEFSKKLYLNPYNKIISNKRIPLFGITLFSCFEPKFTISKLEKDNKYYLARSELVKFNEGEDTVQVDTSIISTLKLKQYEMYSVGADLNVVKVSVPAIKTNFNLGIGLGFGRMGVATPDSISLSDTISIMDTVVIQNNVSENNIGVNTFHANTCLMVNYQSDERYFMNFCGRLRFIDLLHNEFLQVQSTSNKEQLLNYNKFIGKFKSKLLWSAEINAGFAPTSNSSGKLFFRYRYTSNFDKAQSIGFSQLQVGYSYYFK